MIEGPSSSPSMLNEMTEEQNKGRENSRKKSGTFLIKFFIGI